MNGTEITNTGLDVEDQLTPQKEPLLPSIPDAKQITNIELEIGTEEIIYNEPFEIPEESNFHVIMYIFLSFANDIVGKIIFAALLISISHAEKRSFEGIALFLACFYIWRIVFNLFFLFKYGDRLPEFKKTYIFDIVLAVGYISLFGSLYLYLQGKIDQSSLSLYVIPHILCVTIRFCVGEAMRTPYLPFSFALFVESMEILYIAIKLSNPAAHSDWTWVLLYFYLICIVWLIISYLLILVLFMMLGTLIFKRDAFREVDKMALFFMFGILFYVIWNGFIYYYLLSGFQGLAEKGVFGSGATITELNTRLVTVAYAMFVCAVITLLFLIIFLIYLKENMVRAFNQGKANQISLTSFANSLNLGIVQQSDNYFKKKSERDIELGDINNRPEIATCIVCCEAQSEVLIQPCGHSGICKNCMTECLKNSDKCPHCKALMTKVYLIYFDQEKKAFFAKGALKFKSNLL